MSGNLKIGEINCPNCGAKNDVLENKNGAGYIFCHCGLHVRWSKALTKKQFSVKPNYEEIANAENEPKAPEGRNIPHTANTKQPAETVDGNGGILDWWNE